MTRQPPFCWRAYVPMDRGFKRRGEEKGITNGWKRRKKKRRIRQQRGREGKKGGKE